MEQQVYLLHLIDGSVVKAYEDADTPKDIGFIGEYISAHPNRVFKVGDPENGFVYVPKRNIVCVSVEK